jgi:hypothetical protein
LGDSDQSAGAREPSEVMVAPTDDRIFFAHRARAALRANGLDGGHAPAGIALMAGEAAWACLMRGRPARHDCTPSPRRRPDLQTLALAFGPASRARSSTAANLALGEKVARHPARCGPRSGQGGRHDRRLQRPMEPRPRPTFGASGDPPHDSEERGDRRVHSVASNSERARLPEVDDKSADQVKPDQHARSRHRQIWPRHHHPARHHPRQGEAQ